MFNNNEIDVQCNKAQNETNETIAVKLVFIMHFKHLKLFF